MADDDGGGERSFSDFGVLYRLSALSRPLVEAFERLGIPYQTTGQTPLTEYKDVRAVLACLWYQLHPEVDFPLQQALPQKQQQKAIQMLSQPEFGEGRNSVAGRIHRVQAGLSQGDIFAFDEKSQDRLRRLALLANPFEDRLQEFLESTVLLRETDAHDPRADRVSLMTLHASKGLEFPVVFIVGCEDDLIPYRRDDKPTDLEEERRLFYVGMTRAQQRLILSHARSRFLFGRRRENPPSPFLDDIENKLKELKRSTARKPAKEKPEDRQMPLF